MITLYFFPGGEGISSHSQLLLLPQCTQHKAREEMDIFSSTFSFVFWALFCVFLASLCRPVCRISRGWT